MPTQFIFLKSYNHIINIDNISQVQFDPKEYDADDPKEEISEAVLTIHVADDEFTIEGDDAEQIYLQLVKKLPNIIVVE